MPSSDYTISVLLRTRDIENRLEELIFSLARQTLRLSELVVVDNFSSDRELKAMSNLLLRAKREFFNNLVRIKLVPLAEEDFSYPFSANIGVATAEGDLVCITNGHSLPYSYDWLRRGVVHFDDPQVAGVGGYFTPHSDGTVWEEVSYNLWKWLSQVSRAYVRDNYFSTVTCILRKSRWAEYPFDENLPLKIPNTRMFGGEDYDWAVEMISRGYRIVMEPEFSVYHCHHENLVQLFRKYLIWRRIRMRIRAFERPRKSYTELKKADLPFGEI